MDKNLEPVIVRFATTFAEPYPIQIKGESFYRENIKEICGYYDDEGYFSDDHIACLILENNNLNDEYAVRIEINNKIVGYLARPAAKIYRIKITELGIPNCIGSCYASIRGGFITKSGAEADFGVRLDLDLDELKLAPEKTTQAAVQPAAKAETRPDPLAYLKAAYQPVETFRTQPPKIKPVKVNSNKSPKNFWALLLIFVLSGYVGGHRYYAGRGSLLYSITLAYFMFGYIFDFIVIILGQFTDKQGHTISP